VISFPMPGRFWCPLTYGNFSIPAPLKNILEERYAYKIRDH
jgi:hypothetical protein